jgi:hypothetical protein
MLDDKLDKALAECIKQWNIAERRIKKAEQVRGNEVVSSAIFELRYAGRKIIDALYLCLTSDLKDPEVYAKVHAFIADATEDCVKAKHDAIDSMMDFVVIWFNEVEKQLSLATVQQFFPDYLETSGLINGIQNRIEESRQDRTKLRDSIYDAIDDGGDYQKILNLFDRMRNSKERVNAAIAKQRREHTWMRRLAIAGAITGALALIGEGIHLYFVFNPTAVASSPSTGAKPDGAPPLKR